MGKKSKVVVNGREFANRGMKESDGTPMKCSSNWQKLSSGGDVPSKVDLRPWCSPVEDQSRSNSCCANAVAGAYEYLNRKHCAATGDEPGDISRLFIYYVGREYDNMRYRQGAGVKDEGMTIDGALSSLEAKGSCIEAEWPFNLARVNSRPTAQCFQQAADFKIRDAVKVPVDADKMKSVIASGYPIVFGLKLTQAFFRPGPSGRVSTPDPSDPRSAEHGLHAMVACGYDDERRTFIVRNSWGANWGDRGYCYIPYNYLANRKFNFCGQFAIRGLDSVDLTPDSNPHLDAKKCPSGHPLQHVDPYGDQGFHCVKCEAYKGGNDLSWHCEQCGYDQCEDCMGGKQDGDAVVPPQPEPEPDYEGETRTYTNDCGIRAAVRASPDLGSDHVTNLDLNTTVKVAPPHSQYENHPLVTNGRRIRLVAPVKGYASLVNSMGDKIFSLVVEDQAARYYRGRVRAHFTFAGERKEMELSRFALAAEGLSAEGRDQYGEFDLSGSWNAKGEVRAVKQYRGKNKVHWRLRRGAGGLEGPWIFNENDSWNSNQGNKVTIEFLEDGEGGGDEEEKGEEAPKWTYSGRAEGCYYGDRYNGQEKPIVFQSLSVAEDGSFAATASDQWGSLSIAGRASGNQVSARAEYAAEAAEGGGGCYPMNWELWYDANTKTLDGKWTDAREGGTATSELKIVLTQGVARCGQGHPLVPVDPYGANGYICNRCRKLIKQHEQPISHHCKQCGYDCCPDCLQKQLDEEEKEADDFQEIEEEEEEEGGGDEGDGEAFDPETEFSARLEARRVFERHDIDNSGTIDADELRLMLRQMGLPDQKVVAKGFMKNFDKNNDGTICFKEFLGILGLSYADGELGVTGGGLPPVTKKELAVDFRPLESPAQRDWAGTYVDLFCGETPLRVVHLNGPPSEGEVGGAAPTLGTAFGSKVIKWGDGETYWQRKEAGDALPPAPTPPPAAADEEGAAMHQGGAELKLFVGTFNMGERPPANLDAFLPPGMPGVDVVAIGLQDAIWRGGEGRAGAEEMAGASHGADAENSAAQSSPHFRVAHRDDRLLYGRSRSYGILAQVLDKQLGPHWVLAARTCRGKMQLRVYVRVELAPQVHDVEVSAENTGGLSGAAILATKGGLVAKLAVEGTTLSFVACELSGDTTKVARQTGEILLGTSNMGGNVIDVATQFHHTFLFGSLGAWSGGDALKEAIWSGQLLRGFQVGGWQEANAADQILHKSLPGLADLLRVDTYANVPEVVSSPGHLPVAARYTIAPAFPQATSGEALQPATLVFSNLKGKDLEPMDRDVTGGHSDPYVEFAVDPDLVLNKSRGGWPRTRTIGWTNNPDWGDDHVTVRLANGDRGVLGRAHVFLVLMDKDPLTADELIGVGVLPLRDVLAAPGGTYDFTLPVEKRGRTRGEVSGAVTLAI